VVFSPDGSLLAAGGRTGPIHVWEIPSSVNMISDHSKEVAVLRGHSSFVIGVAFSPDGRFLATGSRDGTTRLWDVSRCREMGGSGAEVSVFRGHKETVRSVAFSSDGQWLVSGSDDDTARVWTVGTGCAASFGV